MGDIAAQKGRMQHAGQFDIVNEQCLAAQETRILVAGDGSTKAARRHGDQLRMRCAASITASTIC